MSKRYLVLIGSESGHCCFAASVVDTQTQVASSVAEHKFSPMRFLCICECDIVENANKICEALNKRLD